MAYFEKVLTEVDVKKRMAIPTNFIRHLPQCGRGQTICFPVHDVSGNVWENFEYCIRSECQDYPEPVFRGDWLKYVRAKNLTPGDRIIFRVEENGAGGAPRYTIAAQRRVVILGAEIGWTEEFWSSNPFMSKLV